MSNRICACGRPIFGHFGPAECSTCMEARMLRQGATIPQIAAAVSAPTSLRDVFMIVDEIAAEEGKRDE